MTNRNTVPAPTATMANASITEAMALIGSGMGCRFGLEFGFAVSLFMGGNQLGPSEKRALGPRFRGRPRVNRSSCTQGSTPSARDRTIGNKLPIDCL